MIHKATETTVTPAVLKWARNTSGYSHNDVASHLGVSPELVLHWEKESEPVILRISQLENLASYYKRPLATLLLSTPPSEPEPPKDFRRALDIRVYASHDSIEIRGVIPLELALPTTARTSGCMFFYRNICLV